MKVKKVVQETADVKTIIVERRKMEFKPGQFCMLELEGEIKPFSIASSPTEDFLMFTTKISDSSFKQAFDRLKPGDDVSVMGPNGRFVFEEKPDIIMLSGGIGITPLRSMMKYATDTKSKSKITLFYSNRSLDEIVFREELDEMERENKNLKILQTITREAEEWKGLFGRIDSDMIRKHAENFQSATYYICGPPAMVEAMLSVMNEMNIPQQNIRIERFSGY